MGTSLGRDFTSIFKGFDKLPFLEPIGPASIGLIAFNGLWDYDGWNLLNYVAEEIKVNSSRHEDLTLGAFSFSS